MANGQFVLADVPGAFQRGEQFRQQQQLRPLEIAIAQQNVGRGQQAIRQGEQGLQFGQVRQRALEQQIDQRTDKQKNQSLFNTALLVDGASDEEIIPILESQISKVQGLGGDPKESIRALGFARQGDFKTVREGAKNLINVGVRQGDIKPLGVAKLSSLQQKVAAEGLDPNTPEGQRRAREITQGTRTDPSLKPSDQQLLNKATEGQLATAGFANRVNSANKVFERLGNVEGFDPTAISSAILGALPLGNLVTSSEQQEFIQAKRDFITALLRKESGAAIGQDEFENEDKKFFPQIGDKPAVLEAKKKGRQRAFDNLRKQSKGVFDVQFESNETGDLTPAEQAELAELERQFGGQ